MLKAGSLVIAGALLAACSSEVPPPTAPISVPVVSQPLHAPDGAAAANGGNFGAPLSAEEEVMPAGIVNESTARGNAVFQVNADGTSISYRLIVANIENVFQAHIHQGPAGSNGGVVVWLYPSTAPGAGAPGGGRIEGVIAEGTITAANLVGALAGQPLSALLADLTSGNAYVNVHTNDGVAPANTGPGDFPGGEVRGQVAHRGH